MILNHAKLSDNLKKGCAFLASYGFLTLDESGTIITAIPDDKIMIEKKPGEITITYDTTLHFYMALARSLGMDNETQHIIPKIQELGFMLDCSRNAVPKPDMVKQLISLLVLSGYTYLQLYTEETYELPNEPYFGYARGRYTAEELNEIIEFADIFGLEIVPCIQTLAHLSNLGIWATYLEYMDLRDTLLAKDERTYNLIRKSLRFWKSIVHTNRINIGTDEAFLLGRGKYIDQYGYKSKHTIYIEHLKKVFDICKEEGFEPEFWADAFCRTDCSVEEISSIFDGTQTPIHWCYGITGKEAHCNILNKHIEYAGKVIFAGSIWTYLGYAGDNDYVARAVKPAFEAALECGVNDILMTAWGDFGAECSVFAGIPSIWYAAELLYPCKTDNDKIITSMTGYSKAEWMLCDKLNKVRENPDRINTASKYILHNDFLIGMMNCHTPDDADEHYQKLIPELAALACRNSQYSYIFQAYNALCQTLALKATFGKRLYRAYRDNDLVSMTSIKEELPEIKKSLQEFYRLFRTLWLKENKGFGFEVMDVRIGGLIGRIDTVSIILTDYLEGRTEKIYELEGERLPLDFGENLQGDDIYAPCIGHWKYAYTVNHLS